MIYIYIILGGLIYIYLYYTWYATNNILNSLLLSKNRKRLHIIMVWLLPFLWYYVFIGFIIHNTGVMTKEKREKLARKNAGGFHESGKGMIPV